MCMGTAHKKPHHESKKGPPHKEKKVAERPSHGEKPPPHK